MKNVRKFKLIECQGTPYEIGLQWGEGCKENILKIAENICNGMAFYYKTSREEVISNAMKFFPAAKEFDPYLIEIMRGQADATGLSLEEIFTQKCFNELTFYYNDISGLCTSFAATGNATQDGKTILGQNIDFLPEAPIDLLKVHHTNGIKQLILSFSNSSEFIFSSAGFGMCANATLAAIGENFLFNIPVGCYLPRAMRAENIHEAMDVLKQVARGLGYYHLADKNGHILGIESIYNDFELLYPEKDMLLHSNHYLTERFKKEDSALQLQSDSYHRIDRIRSLMDKHYGNINVEIAMEILADHDQYPNSICRHINSAAPISSKTLASFIMVPEEGAVYIAAGNPCEYEYVRYEF